MTTKHLGRQTAALASPPSIAAFASVAGKKEGDGPLSAYFDQVCPDATLGEKTWEQGEAAMQRLALSLALNKAGLSGIDLDYLFAGDLLNQCIGSAYGHKDSGIPFFGLYGACSTMAESLSLAAMAVDGGFARRAGAVTSSHFCTAERQYRTPLEYGSQRTPTAQWTVTGAGATLLAAEGPGPYVTHITTGVIQDKGISDANNMGAAMAPAACATLNAHFQDTGRPPDFYDLIVTGDLGDLGKEIVLNQFARQGVDLSRRYDDCGVMIFDPERQDVHCGGSGCGCSATVLNGYLLQGMLQGRWKHLLFCATGALHSPTSLQQGLSIPGICHAVAISTEREG